MDDQHGMRWRMQSSDGYITLWAPRSGAVKHGVGGAYGVTGQMVARRNTSTNGHAQLRHAPHSNRRYTGEKEEHCLVRDRAHTPKVMYRGLETEKTHTDIDIYTHTDACTHNKKHK